MKIYKLYESILNEAEITSCVKQFGYDLFGDQFGSKEPNTPTENDYLEQIRDFTDNMYGEETTQEFITSLKNLKSCVKQYPDILIPESKTVFRGTMLPVSYFIENKQPINIEGKNEYLYKAKSLVQSWSIAYESASNFGSYDTLLEVINKIDYDASTKEGLMLLLKNVLKEDLRLPFILAYNTTPDEFIFNSEYFMKLSQMSHENELIRFTNKPINTVAWLNDEVAIPNRAVKFIEDINKAISVL